MAVLKSITALLLAAGAVNAAALDGGRKTETVTTTLPASTVTATVTATSAPSARPSLGLNGRSIALDFLKQTGTNVVAVNRFWQGTQHDHFYTSNPAEIPSNYVSEGILGYVLIKQLSISVPLHRVYHPSGHHFYTANAAEFNNVITNLGYKDEGVVGYVFDKQVGVGTSPIYRSYNPAFNDHLFTMDANEHKTATTKYGYNDEGIAGYIWSQRTFKASS